MKFLFMAMVLTFASAVLIGTSQAQSPSATPKHSLTEEYANSLKTQVRKVWLLPKGVKPKRVVVEFKLNSSGAPSDLKIAHSAESAALDEASLKAVQKAAPFRSLPSGCAPEVDVQISFDYETGDLKVLQRNNESQKFEE